LSKGGSVGAAITVTAGAGGIGTATTGAVGGGVTISAGTGGANTTGGVGGDLTFNAGIQGAGGSAGGGSIIFRTATTTSLTTAMTIVPSGNVGINTSNPTYKLSIATATASDRGINITHTAATGVNYGIVASVTGASTQNTALYVNAVNAATNYGIYIDPTLTASASNFSLYNNSTAKSYFAGNIGIGVTSPSTALHVISTTEQLRLGYDASNYLSATVSSAGAVTLTATGASAGITISNDLTVSDAKNVILNTTTGTKIGTATGQKLAFHNSTPVIQRAGAAQAAAATTASTNTVPFGYTTSAQADAVISLLNEIRATLVEKGIMKGAA